VERCPPSRWNTVRHQHGIVSAMAWNTQQIHRLAYYDSLTGLPNRRLLHDRLNHAMLTARRNGHGCAIVFIDLDNFKTLNDTRGHDIGDLLLRQVAQRLSGCVRAGDTVSRFGGDEFVMVLEGQSPNASVAADRAETLAAKVLRLLSEPYVLAGHQHYCTPSIGITLFSGGTCSADELLKQADLAMYRSKALGRNTMRFFDPEMQTIVDQHAMMERDMREGLAEGQFRLNYQPQMGSDGKLSGAEALLRWHHPTRGTIPPGQFIPRAEETGQILQLGRWVIETACAQLANWSMKPGFQRLTIAVNVSARQFYQVDFAQQLLEILERTGANPRQLKLELTESMLALHVEEIIEKMVVLKSSGIRFSLDDFGTGYSSLAYLKRMPLDELKIDQGFVRDVLADANDAAIARMVVVLAGSMGIDVMAEGVETEPQREFLASIGCRAYQGYLLSRPLPIEHFETFIETAGVVMQ
ncbi:putative bifunctional diguanylate cyclase/phosphodiesterase, partial [Hydrogenophaga defluvii]